MQRHMVTAEGSARQVYPDMNVVAKIRESVKRLVKSRFTPDVILSRMGNALANLWAYQRELPSQIQQIIGKLESGARYQKARAFSAVCSGAVKVAISPNITSKPVKSLRTQGA